MTVMSTGRGVYNSRKSNDSQSTPWTELVVVITGHNKDEAHTMNHLLIKYVFTP